MPTIDGNDGSNTAAAEVVRRELRADSEKRGGRQNAWSLGIFLRDDEGEVAGGAVGSAFWDWLFVDLLWVREDLRGQGWGGRLLQAAEEEARARGSIGIWLDTFSFQHRPFYEARGYELFGEIADHPPGERRHFLKKLL